MDHRAPSPQRYDLVVRGRVSGRYVQALDRVTVISAGGQTRLRAELVDQSELYGLLNRLRDLGIELVSVQPVAEAQDAG